MQINEKIKLCGACVECDWYFGIPYWSPMSSQKEPHTNTLTRKSRLTNERHVSCKYVQVHIQMCLYLYLGDLLRIYRALLRKYSALLPNSQFIFGLERLIWYLKSKDLYLGSTDLEPSSLCVYTIPKIKSEWCVACAHNSICVCIYDPKNWRHASPIYTYTHIVYMFVQLWCAYVVWSVFPHKHNPTHIGVCVYRCT